MKLFRSMIEDSDGLPAMGSSGRSLGVRLGDTSTPDVLAVEPNDMILPNQGGMSVAPGNPLHLLSHRRPQSLGGSGLDPVWSFEREVLWSGPPIRQGGRRHGVVAPLRAMTLSEYQSGLSATRRTWKLFCR
mgnify:CR=1 FL=1